MLGAFDKQNQLSSAQAITTGTAVSTNSYELGVAGMDPSIGRKMGVCVFPTEDAAGDVVATSYEFQAIMADNSALTSNKTVIGSSGAIAGSAILAGRDPIEIPLRAGSVTKKFIGYQVVVVGGTNPTAAFDAYYVPVDEIPHNKHFPKAVDTLV
jgi:hypothetical protein